MNSLADQQTRLAGNQTDTQRSALFSLNSDNGNLNSCVQKDAAQLSWQKSGLEGLAKEEILAKVVWTEKLWNAKQKMDQEEEEEREIISISEESSTVEWGIPYSPIASETDSTTVATGGWRSIEKHQWNSGPGLELENPAVGLGLGLLEADGPQVVGPSGDISPYEMAVNFVDGWFPFKKEIRILCKLLNWK